MNASDRCPSRAQRAPLGPPGALPGRLGGHRGARPGRRPGLAWVALGALLASSSALAENDVDLEVSARVPVGAPPTVTLKLNQDVARISLLLKGQGPDGAQTSRLDKRNLKAGGSVVHELPKPKKPGRTSWSGSLDVVFANGSEGSMPLAFETEAMDPPEIALVDDQLDLAAHRVVVTLTRPASRVELEVTGDDGKLIASTAQDFEGDAAGSPLVVTYKPRSKATVLRLKLVGYDVDGFFSPTLEVFPWKVEIPHEEVVFDSGQADLKADEEPKLQAVLGEIQTTVKRYGHLADLKLYILGHTDSVGSSASNRELSGRRAETIARWFGRAGVKVPILVRGFGEDQLKVGTPDETDEVRNRRVDYVLAVDPPVAGPGWKKVR